MPRFFRKIRPDIHASRAAWEQSWEEDFKAVYHPDNLKYAPHLKLCAQPAYLEAQIFNEIALSLYNNVYYICRAQQMLARDAAERFARDDFENKWRSIPHERRCDFVLEGIYRTLCFPDMEKARKFCPDSTLSHLASGEGSTYIDMLKTVMPADLDVPLTEPIQFPHPIMDRLLTLKPEDEHKFEMAADNRQERLWRTYCMTNIIWNIFVVFSEIRVTQFIMKPPRLERYDTRSDPSPLGRLRAAQTKEINDIRKLKQVAYGCRICNRPETALSEGRKLMACSKCRKIGRKVWYCSPECQKIDWTSGLARPHRYICGRLLGREDLVTLSYPQGNLACGPGSAKPRPGYKPSPALLHQKTLLSTHPHVDYWFFPPYPTPGVGIVLHKAQIKAQVRQHREKAITSGDPQSVAMIYLTMIKEPGFKNYGILPIDIQKQLEREFGLTLETHGLVNSDLQGPPSVTS